VALLVALGATAGCGSSRAESAVEASDAFHEAVADGHGARACALLAPSTRSELEQSAGAPCAVAVLDEDVPLAASMLEVRAFGTMAQVRYRDDVSFLTRVDDRWAVLAAGCAPDRRGGYDCRVQGD
jgi:hypothetical protein